MNAERLHLLIVEDEEAHVEAIRRAFDANGTKADIRAAGTLREYRELIAAHPPDIALVDLNLPDGRAVQVLTHPPEDAPFPIVIMTAFGNQQIVVEVMKAGALDYVVKSPETFAAMPHTVESLLREWKLLQTHKHVEDALRASEQKHRVLFESSRDAIMTIEPPSWRFTSGNPATLAMFGAKSEEEFISHGPWKLSPERQPDGRASAGKAKEMIETAVREGSCFFGWTHRRLGGEEFPADVLLTRMKLGGKVMVQATVRDISVRKRAEESHTRLATAVEQSAETIVITDVNATILYANPAFEKTTGYSHEEAIGQNPRILKSGKQDAEFYRRMWAVLTRGEVWSSRMINKRRDGTLYEEDASISPVRDAAGKIVNYVAVKRDVSREAKLENQLRQAQKMEVVGRLAGGVAHDFNNLLMAIMGYSELALNALPANDRVRKHIEEVRTAGERAAALTRQLLAFSRKQVLLPKVLDLKEITANLSKMLRRLIGEDIQVITTFDPTLGRVLADPGQSEQVITNLAVNARDAMPDGGTLTIRTANVELDEAYCRQHEEVTPGRCVLLTVADTGTGMTDEVKAHLFEPFFTTKDQGKGTGLGLATVFGIVKQSGGHITVYSELGHGTTFKVYLPRVEEAAEVAVPTGTPVEFPRGTETILLVEDEDQVRSLARMALEECGYTMLVAGNGPDAIQLAGQNEGKIQMLLTDVIMPEMSGRVLAPLLMSLNPGIKVLYMSGYTDTTIIRKDLLVAGSAFLQKPFSLDVLARKVREVLDAKEEESGKP